MTVPVSIQQVIRSMADAGCSGRQIAGELGISRNTVAKYLAKVDYSPGSAITRSRSLVDPYAPIVVEWLRQDQGLPAKQRHTAKRVWSRLVEEEGFTGSYYSVRRWVQRYRLEHRGAGEGFSELAWAPGCAQVDYGQALAEIGGERQTIHVLVVSFPFSNARFAVASPGETAECVCEGLRMIFEHIGAVPRTLVFDNATGIGRRKAGSVVLTRLFEAFATHYRPRVIFTNPNSGNEKGSVENAVGYLRRNLMVPLPVSQSLTGLSRVLLDRCQTLLDQPHYRKHTPIRELFATDLEACLALPSIGFDPCTWETRMVDLVGNIHIGHVRYLAGSRYAQQRLHVGIRASSIQILDPEGTQIVEYPRIYGPQAQSVVNPVGVLQGLIKRPGALRQCVIRPFLPNPLLNYLDQAEPAEQRRVLRIMVKACQDVDFQSVAAITNDLVTARQEVDEASVLLAAKTASEPPTNATVVDLSAYDQIMKKGA